MRPHDMAQARIAAEIGDDQDRELVATASAQSNVVPLPIAATPWFGDVIDLTNAYATEPPPRDDVLIGIEPGDVVCLGAPGGGSKTQLVQSLVHDLAFGGKISSVATMLVPDKEQSSLLLTAEESANEVVRQMHRFAALLDGEQRVQAVKQIEVRSMKKNVPILIYRDGTVNMETHALLERHCYGKRFVILDPLGRFVRAEKNDEATMITLVTTLEEIGRRAGCVFALPHHVGKSAIFQGNGDSALAMKGSTALVDSCRMALMIFRPPKTVAQKRGITSSRYRIVKIDKANYRADKGEIWFWVRADGTLAYDEKQTLRNETINAVEEIHKATRGSQQTPVLAGQSTPPDKRAAFFTCSEGVKESSDEINF